LSDHATLMAAKRLVLAQFAKQIEEIGGNVFAQRLVVDRAQGTTNDIRLVLFSIRRGPSTAFLASLEPVT
jgi:hypothetical protein